MPYSKAEVQSVGHFVGIAESQLWLAADFCKIDKIVNTVVAIPVGWIMSVKKVDVA